MTHTQYFNMKYLKKEDLVVGRWYHTKELDYYFKFLSLELVRDYYRIHHSKHIHTGRASNTNNYFSNKMMIDTVTEVGNMQIVYRHFPEERLDTPIINDTYSII